MLVERAVPLLLAPYLRVLGTQLKTKEKTLVKESGKVLSQRAEQTPRKSR